MRYALIRTQDNIWEFEDDLAVLQKRRKRLQKKKVITALVLVLEDEDDPVGQPNAVTALLGIIDAANANPDPIHYRVREAITNARLAIRSDAERSRE